MLSASLLSPALCLLSLQEGFHREPGCPHCCPPDGQADTCQLPTRGPHFTQCRKSLAHTIIFGAQTFSSVISLNKKGPFFSSYSCQDLLCVRHHFRHVRSYGKQEKQASSSRDAPTVGGRRARAGTSTAHPQKGSEPWILAGDRASCYLLAALTIKLWSLNTGQNPHPKHTGPNSSVPHGGTSQQDGWQQDEVLLTPTKTCVGPGTVWEGHSLLASSLSSLLWLSCVPQGWGQMRGGGAAALGLSGSGISVSVACALAAASAPVSSARTAVGQMPWTERGLPSEGPAPSEALGTHSPLGPCGWCQAGFGRWPQGSTSVSPEKAPWKGLSPGSSTIFRTIYAFQLCQVQATRGGPT